LLGVVRSVLDPLFDLFEIVELEKEELALGEEGLLLAELVAHRADVRELRDRAREIVREAAVRVAVGRFDEDRQLRPAAEAALELVQSDHRAGGLGEELLQVRAQIGEELDAPVEHRDRQEETGRENRARSPEDECRERANQARVSLSPREKRDKQ